MSEKIQPDQSNELLHISEFLLQIKSKIEIMSQASNHPLQLLPPSVVDTDMLYKIAQGYLYMYNKLEKNALLKLGYNIKSNPVIH